MRIAAVRRLALLAALSLPLGPGAVSLRAAPPDAPAAPLTWRLTHSRIVSAGRTFADNAGLRMTGRLVEAEAASGGAGAPFPRGTFRLMLEAFRPRADMPGQKAGRWYAHGAWTITDADADPGIAAARHGPGVVRGRLTADLPFDPASGPGAVDAKVRLHTRPGGARGPGVAGTFTGNEKFEGTIVLDGKR